MPVLHVLIRERPECACGLKMHAHFVVFFSLKYNYWTKLFHDNNQTIQNWWVVQFVQLYNNSKFNSVYIHILEKKYEYHNYEKS